MDHLARAFGFLRVGLRPDRRASRVGSAPRKSLPLPDEMATARPLRQSALAIAPMRALARLRGRARQSSPRRNPAGRAAAGAPGIAPLWSGLLCNGAARKTRRPGRPAPSRKPEPSIRRLLVKSTEQWIKRRRTA